MSKYASKVISIAESEVGYLEKASHKNLDDKTANAGSNNYTKYARDLDAVPGFYNGKKQSFAWCDVFVDWVFVKAFGVVTAKSLLCQPDRSLGAGCYYSARYYKQNNQFHTADPRPGDQIFFWNSKKNDVAHTGLVYKVDKTHVYTIEGNTSGASGVVANGGGVCKKKYKLTYDRIYGYGRPAYDSESIEYEPVVTVLEWQFAAIADGFAFPKYGADGKWGKECASVAAKAIVKRRLTYQHMNLTKLIQRAVGVSVDGKFGSQTKNAVMEFQSKHGLVADGEVGPATWTVILGV